jgi:hypothetical protein
MFEARFGGKDCGLSQYNPSAEDVGGWDGFFCMKWLRTLKSLQIFKIKIKKLKPIAVDVLFKAYPMVPLSCRSNLDGRYL